MILVKHYIEKYENVLKFTFHGFAAHLKDFVSERRKNSEFHEIVEEFNKFLQMFYGPKFWLENKILFVEQTGINFAVHK